MFFRGLYFNKTHNFRAISNFKSINISGLSLYSFSPFNVFIKFEQHFLYSFFDRLCVILIFTLPPFNEILEKTWCFVKDYVHRRQRVWQLSGHGRAVTGGRTSSPPSPLSPFTYPPSRGGLRPLCGLGQAPVRRLRPDQGKAQSIKPGRKLFARRRL